MADPATLAGIAADLADDILTEISVASARIQAGVRDLRAPPRTPAMARADAIEISDEIGHAAGAARSLTVALRLALSAPSEFDAEERCALRSLAGLLRQELDDAVDNADTLMKALDGVDKRAAA